MALKQSEKTLVGLMMMVGGIALVVGFGLPQWDAYQSSSARVDSLNLELKALEAQKSSLSAQIALLERNTDVPQGVEIRRYTPQNREEIIKAMLDQVVRTASGTGNRFISLVPTETEPMLPPPPPPTPEDGKTTSSPDTEQAASPPRPLLDTFGYELSIRGTYNSIQAFLREMAEQKELLELYTIELANEAGPDRAQSAGNLTLDPEHPIQLTTKIRLALQPSPI